MRLRDVEDAEAVVVAGDDDVAPEGEVGVCASRRRVVQAVVEPHVRRGRRRAADWTARRLAREGEQRTRGGGGSSRRWDANRFSQARLGSNRNFARVLSVGIRVGYARVKQARQNSSPAASSPPGLLRARCTRARSRRSARAPRRPSSKRRPAGPRRRNRCRRNRGRRSAARRCGRAPPGRLRRRAASRSGASCCRGRSSRRRGRRVSPRPLTAG